MFGVLGIVGRETDPVEHGEARTGFEDAEDLGAHGAQVLAQTEGLDLVEAVEGLVVKGQREAVEVLLDEGVVGEAGFLVELARLGNLVGVDVQPGDVGAAYSGDMRGHAPATTAQIQHALTGLDLQVFGNGALVEQLVLEHGGLATHGGGDVHLLDIAQGTQVVEHAVVGFKTIANFFLVIGAQDLDHGLFVGPIQVVDDIGGHKVIDLLLGEAGQVAEGGPEALPAFGGSSGLVQLAGRAFGARSPGFFGLGGGGRGHAIEGEFVLLGRGAVERTAIGAPGSVAGGEDGLSHAIEWQYR